MARGIQQQIDLWKIFMQAQMFPLRQTPLLKDEKGQFIKNEDGTYKRGTETIQMVQGALRPIQLYEYVFPQECLTEVLAMMNLHKQDPMRADIAMQAWIFRKLLTAKKIPDLPEEIRKKESWQLTNKYIGGGEAIAIYPIGIREDPVKDFTFGDKGFYQEGL